MPRLKSENASSGLDPVSLSLLGLAGLQRGAPFEVAEKFSKSSKAIERSAAALAAGLIMRAGIPLKNERLAYAGQRYQSHSLPEICREAVRLAGGTTTYDRYGMIRAAVSGGAMTQIFTTSVNAQLLAAWDDEEDSTVGWVGETDVLNFKEVERASFIANTELELLGRGGTAGDATPSDAVERYRIARYSKKFTIDEMDILDDRFDVLVDMPKEMGKAAAHLRPDLVYAIMLANPQLADAVAIFHASHANLVTGGGSVLQAASLKAAMAAMAEQQYGGRGRNIKARYLLTPPELGWTAKELISSTQIIRSTGADATVESGRNMIADENLIPVSDSRLGTQGVTDPSSGTHYAGTVTNWFLSSKAGRTIEVAYLQGTNRAPTVRSWPLDEGEWGVCFDVKLDIGAKALDYRGLCKSAGA